MTARVRINRAEIDRLLYGPAGPVHREVSRVTRAVQAGAKVRAPIDRGPLRSSITATVTAEPGQRRVRGRVGSLLPYALWQEGGTGIYGPRGAPIRPRRAARLVFRPKGARGVVFARQVRGVRPRHFLLQALTAASPWPVRRRT